MATIKLHRIEYIIVTDSVGEYGTRETAVQNIIQRLDPSMEVEVFYDDDKGHEKFKAYISLPIETSVAGRRNLLAQVVNLLRKNGLISSSLDELLNALS